ncbi:hypothetical protein D3C72_2127740 [compost metagenome]
MRGQGCPLVLLPSKADKLPTNSANFNETTEAKRFQPDWNFFITFYYCCGTPAGRMTFGRHAGNGHVVPYAPA